MNTVNHRKEFFLADLAAIREEFEEMGPEVNWTMAAEAREWRETQAIASAIEADPSAREAWASRQLVLENLESDQEEQQSDEAVERAIV